MVTWTFPERRWAEPGRPSGELALLRESRMEDRVLGMESTQGGQGGTRLRLGDDRADSQSQKDSPEMSGVGVERLMSTAKLVERVHEEKRSQRRRG